MFEGLLSEKTLWIDQILKEYDTSLDPDSSKICFDFKEGGLGFNYYKILAVQLIYMEYNYSIDLFSFLIKVVMVSICIKPTTIQVWLK